MMSRRALLGLCAASLATLGAGLALRPRGAADAIADAGGLVFPGLAANLERATKLELRKQDQVLLLVRRGETWVLPGSADYPVRAAKARETLTGLTELRFIEARTADPALYERLGVEDPALPGATGVLLRLLDAAGAPLAEVILGRRRVRTQGNLPEAVFLRIPGQVQSWLAEGRVTSETDAGLWIDRDIANLPASRLQKVEVRRLGEPELVLARDGGRLKLTTPAEAPALDEVALDEIGRAFEFLTFVEVKPTSAETGEALGEARFSLTDDLAILTRLSRAGEAVWLRLAAEGGEEAAALNARWRGWAYQVGAWKEKAMLPRLADLEAKPPAPPSLAPPK